MKNIVLSIAVLFLGLSAYPLFAEERQAPMVAVASNFMGAMEKITAAYEAKTGVKLQTVYSSTGKLYAQVKQGAPYDLFFAADAKRPEILAEEGLCEEPFVYAAGEAVLWTKNKALADSKYWQDVVVRDDINKIAVSNPQTAPYGAAAFEALNRNGILSLIENKLVYGHNVAQPFQYAFHGSVDIGFTALSLALSEKGKQGVYWRMQEAEPVVQKGCVIKKTKNKHGVEAFLAFFRQPGTKTIQNEFGYK